MSSTSDKSETANVWNSVNLYNWMVALFFLRRREEKKSERNKKKNRCVSEKGIVKLLLLEV